MFRLNEAPEMVLSAISNETLKRGCGKFWSALFCIPSFGGSTGCCGSDCKSTDGNWFGCCWPGPVSVESDMTLEGMQGALKQLLMNRETIQKDPETSEKAVIEWQVRETIRLLDKATSDNTIMGSYKAALIDISREVKTRASQQQAYAQLLETEKSPLMKQPLYVPNYGFGSSK